MRSFLDLDTDIRFAVDHFVSQRLDLEEIVLWGLCDGASAALFYAHQDPRVKGLVLLNPWVRTEQGRAQANVQSYYLQRLLSPDFWGKVVGGRFNPLKSGRDLFADALAATGLTRLAQTGSADGECEAVSLPQRMLDDWIRFRGPILLILSGNDLTADEFRQLVARDKNWKRAVADSRVERVEVPGANHTFASGVWREQVERATAKWITSW